MVFRTEWNEIQGDGKDFGPLKNRFAIEPRLAEATWVQSCFVNLSALIRVPTTLAPLKTGQPENRSSRFVVPSKTPMVFIGYFLPGVVLNVACIVPSKYFDSGSLCRRKSEPVNVAIIKRPSIMP